MEDRAPPEVSGLKNAKVPQGYVLLDNSAMVPANQQKEFRKLDTKEAFSANAYQLMCFDVGLLQERMRRLTVLIQNSLADW